MPIYEYVCSNCGKLNEVFQKISDPAPGKCEGCASAGTLSRAVSRTSFVLKGGGWYSDLYASKKKDAGGGESKGDGGEKKAPAESSGSSSTTSPSSTSSSTSPSTPSSGSSGSTTSK